MSKKGKAKAKSQTNSKARVVDGKSIEPLPLIEWQFDDVPDAEVRACVYWEFGRESAFMRDLKRCCESPDSMKMTNTQLNDWIGRDIERVQSLGPPANVLVRGLFLPAGKRPADPGDKDLITGRFPCPWQELDKDERASRSHIQEERDTIPLVPFRRAHWFWAKELAEFIKGKNVKRTAKQKASPVNETAAIEPSLFCYGSEITLVQIAWDSFTNEELRAGFGQWVAANRPRDMPGPDRRGHKLRDLRVALDRLGIMRLLHRHRLSRMEQECPAGFKAFSDYQWHTERMKAGRTFRELLPFLPKGERPLSWPTAGGDRD